MHSFVDLLNEVLITSGLVPVVATGDKTSAAFDRSGHDKVFGTIHVGASGDTLSGSLKWTLSLLECDTSGGTYTAVADSDLIAANGVAAANGIVVDASGEDSKVYSFGYQGTKRYLKLTAVKTGTHTNGTPIGMFFVSQPIQLPAANRVAA